MSSDLNLIIIKCPGCGASLECIPGNTQGKCEYCGSPYMLGSAHPAARDEPRPPKKTDPPKSDPQLSDTHHKEWARRIRKILVKEFKKEHRIDLMEDENALTRINRAVNKRMPELESAGTVEIQIPFITANSAGPLHLIRTITLGELAPK